MKYETVHFVFITSMDDTIGSKLNHGGPLTVGSKHAFVPECECDKASRG